MIFPMEADASHAAAKYHDGLHRICFVPGKIALGAAARHKGIGTIHHISGPPVVTGVIPWVSSRILFHDGRNRELSLSAISLIGVTFAQVFPGIAAYMARIPYADYADEMNRNVPAPAHDFAGGRVAAIS